jgi:twitching motility protein PilT
LKSWNWQFACNLTAPAEFNYTSWVDLGSLITGANDQGASDLHLEPGLPAALRVRGALRVVGEPIPGKALLEIARDLIGHEQWPHFVQRRSFDLSRTIQGIRCRINVLHSSRGVGLAIRLLSSFQATIEKLNLHPDLKKLVTRPNGLIILSGPTGCGKSSTMAALIQEINLAEARHIVTIESPIEYTLRPRMAYIRQREVGRDTPSFEQALLDALREDPDVLMVGEMREPETMRLTLNASETGHLVLATMHSSTCAEALQRIVFAFPAEIQSAVRAQLADCLVAVVCQRLRYRPELKMRVPECEILIPTIPIKSFIRNGDFFKIITTLETGAEHGMWTFARYQTWLENKKVWHFPDPSEKPDSDPAETVPITAPLPVSKPAPHTTHQKPLERAAEASPAVAGANPAPSQPGRIEIEPVEGGLEELIKKLDRPPG